MGVQKHKMRKPYLSCSSGDRQCHHNRHLFGISVNFYLILATLVVSIHGSYSFVRIQTDRKSKKYSYERSPFFTRKLLKDDKLGLCWQLKMSLNDAYEQNQDYYFNSMATGEGSLNLGSNPERNKSPPTSEYDNSILIPPSESSFIPSVEPLDDEESEAEIEESTVDIMSPSSVIEESTVDTSADGNLIPEEEITNNIVAAKELVEPDLLLNLAKESLKKTTTTSLSTPENNPPCIIKVLGVGGGGGNAVNHMIQTKINGVSFWAINTDSQALAKSLAPNTLNIGKSLTRGLGAGGNAAEGAKAALENIAELKEICNGADMVFITAGMGGGTGSGAAPIVAEIAKDECGCLTVGIVTTPFAFEGKKRMQQALAAIEEFRKVVDTLIVVSNEKLLDIVPDNTPVTDAFLVADDILRQGIVGISEIIVKAGLVNVDFADVRAVMQNAGTALIGIGRGTGRHRATDAAIAAISSPLLEYPINKAKRIVFNIAGGEDMGLKEINQASEVIYENADDNSNIIFGATIDPKMAGEISITVLACDFDMSATPATSPLSISPSSIGNTSYMVDDPFSVPVDPFSVPVDPFSAPVDPFSVPVDSLPIPVDDTFSVSSETSSISLVFDDKISNLANGNIEASTPREATSKGGFRRPRNMQKVSKRQNLQRFFQRVLPKTD